MKASRRSATDGSASDLARRPVQLLAEVYRDVLGFRPFRMKPVHFATSLFLSIHGRYRELELLNKMANPKAVAKSGNDQYVTSRLFAALQERKPSILSNAVQEDELALLRSHLSDTFNNDGAALAAAFAPYSTFGHDYSTPAAEYLSNASKLHGHAGSMVCAVLRRSTTGRRALSLARELFRRSELPASALGFPAVQGEKEYGFDDQSSVSNLFLDRRGDVVAEMMCHETDALCNLCERLDQLRPTYTLRYLVLGFGVWFLSSLIKQANQSDTLVFCDFACGVSERVRSQARACFSRSVVSVSAVIETVARGGMFTNDDIPFDVLDRPEVRARCTRDLEQHFRDFSVRIGMAQPRAGMIRAKRFEPTPDTLRVLLMSVLGSDEIVPIDEVAIRLHRSWSLVVGLLPQDHETLHGAGYAPLDEDYDLRANRDGFKDLAIALGLAFEPSDGLILFSLSPMRGN